MWGVIANVCFTDIFEKLMNSEKTDFAHILFSYFATTLAILYKNYLPDEYIDF